eukprot:6186093-Pleurochrysis_carterae.AAC.2
MRLARSCGSYERSLQGAGVVPDPSGQGTMGVYTEAEQTRPHSPIILSSHRHDSLVCERLHTFMPARCTCQQLRGATSVDSTAQTRTCDAP